jgi:hypothetical protein
MFQRLLADRDKKQRKKEREDWMWYEDPYTADADRGTLKSYGHSVPAPTPLFGVEPPLHTA